MTKPREKLAQLGPERLTDHELVVLLLSSGTAEHHVDELATHLLQTIPLTHLPRATLSELCGVRGIGTARASRLLAALELARRGTETPLALSSPQALMSLLEKKFSSQQEYLTAMYLDTRLQLIEQRMIYKGTLDQILIHPRDIFGPALELRAAGVALCHNHPSGDITPSDDDIRTTHRLSTAGEIIGITLIDHLILGSRGRWLSMKAENLLEPKEE
jgi:DNA repair protein RadC